MENFLQTFSWHACTYNLFSENNNLNEEAKKVQDILQGTNIYSYQKRATVTDVSYTVY